MTGPWLTAADSGDSVLEHLDGLPWDQVALPWRWHRCWAQTRGWIAFYVQFRRCPCGAVAVSRHRWEGKNSRRTPGGAALVLPARDPLAGARGQRAGAP